MRNTYFWDAKNKTVIVKPDVVLGSEAVYFGLSEMYSVDEFNSSPLYKYGMYNSKGVWKHIPLDDFPVEFRALLLLIN